MCVLFQQNTVRYTHHGLGSHFPTLQIRHIETAFVPQDVLLRIVETIAQALKLPFVAIASRQESHIAAAYGTQDEQHPLVHIPLLAHHEQVGTLLCSPRQEEVLTEQDVRLLQDLALHS